MCDVNNDNLYLVTSQVQPGPAHWDPAEKTTQ